MNLPDEDPAEFLARLANRSGAIRYGNLCRSMCRRASDGSFVGLLMNNLIRRPLRLSNYLRRQPRHASPQRRNATLSQRNAALMPQHTVSPPTSMEIARRLGSQRRMAKARGKV